MSVRAGALHEEYNADLVERAEAIIRQASLDLQDEVWNEARDDQDSEEP